MPDSSQITILFSDTNGPDINEQSGYRIFRKVGSDPFPEDILIDPLPNDITIVKSDGNTKWTEDDYDSTTDNDNTASSGDITFNDNVEPGVAYFYRIEFYRNSTKESALSDAIGPLQGYTSSGLAYPGGALNYDPSSGISWGNSYCSVAPFIHVDATFEYSKYGGDYSYSGAYLKDPDDKKSYWSTNNVEYGKTADQFENLVRDINLPLEAHYSQLVNWETELNDGGVPVIVQKYLGGSSGTNSMRAGKKQTLTGLFNKYFNNKPFSDLMVKGLSNKATALFLDKGFTAIIVVPGTRPYTQLDADKIDSFESIQTWSSGVDYDEGVYIKARDTDNRWGEYQKNATNDNLNTLNPSENSDWRFNGNIHAYNPVTLGYQRGWRDNTFPLSTHFFTSGHPCHLNTDRGYYSSYQNLPSNYSQLAFDINDNTTWDKVISDQKRQIRDESRVFEYYRFSDGNRLKFRKNDHFYFNNLGVNGSTETPGREFTTYNHYKQDGYTVTVKDLNHKHPFAGANYREGNIYNATQRNQYTDGRWFWFNSFSWQEEGYFKDLIFKTDEDIEKYTKGPKELSVNGLATYNSDAWNIFRHSFEWGNGFGLGHASEMIAPSLSTSVFDNGQTGTFDVSSLLSHNMEGDQFTPAIWSQAAISPQGIFSASATQGGESDIYTTTDAGNAGAYHYFPEDRQVGWKGAFPTHCACPSRALNFYQDFWSDFNEQTFTDLTGDDVVFHTNRSFYPVAWRDYIAAIRDNALSVKEHKAYKYCKTSHIYVLSMRINQDPDGGPNQFTAYLNGKPFLNFYDHYLGFPSTKGTSSIMAGVSGMSAGQVAYSWHNGGDHDCRDKDNYPISCDSQFTYNTKRNELVNGHTDRNGNLVTNTNMDEHRHPIYLPGGLAHNYAASFNMPTAARGMPILNAGFQPGGCRVTPGFNTSQVVPFNAPVLGFSELLFFPELLDYADLKRVIGYLQDKYTGKLYDQEDSYHLGYTYQDNWSNNTSVNNNIIYGSVNDAIKLSKFQQTYTIQTSHSPESGNFYGDGGPISTTIGGWDFQFDNADPKPYPIKFTTGGKRDSSGKSNPQPIFR